MAQIFNNIQSSSERRTVKSTVLSYLYEIASISEDIRAEYLQKLLKRKNSSQQKNVKLLYIIYNYIKEDRMLEWNDDEICKILDITKNMFYCHKSRILKSLRLMHFNWLDIEKEEFSNEQFEKSGNKLLFQFNRAMKMSLIGMNRESKNEFIKLAKFISSKQRTTGAEKLILAKIYRLLVTYYYRKENPIKYNLYFKKCEELIEILLRNKKTKHDSNLILELELLKNYLLSTDTFFKLKNISDSIKNIEIFNRMSRIQKKLKDKKKYVIAILGTGILYKTHRNYSEALKMFKKGEQLSKKYNFQKEYLVFRMYTLLTELYTGKPEQEYTLSEILKCYEKLKELKIDGYLKERALINCNELTSIQEDKNLIYKFLSEYNCHYILTYGYYGALRSLYAMKFAYYQSEIQKFRLEKYGRHQVPVVYDTDKVFKKKFENSIDELFRNFNRMRNTRTKNIHFKWEGLYAALTSEFWKGTEINFDYAKYIMRGAEWLKKSWGNILARDTMGYASIKLCMEILEDSKHLDKFKLLDKYEYRFKELSNKLTEIVDENILALYAIFSYTASIIEHKEFKNIIAEVYLALNKKHPEKFYPIISRLGRQAAIKAA